MIQRALYRAWGKIDPVGLIDSFIIRLLTEVNVCQRLCIADSKTS